MDRLAFVHLHAFVCNLGVEGLQVPIMDIEPLSKLFQRLLHFHNLWVAAFEPWVRRK